MATMESQLRYLYRLQLIDLRYNYLTFLRNRFKKFIIRFNCFLIKKNKYLIKLLKKIKIKKNDFRKYKKLKTQKQKIIKLLTLESIKKENPTHLFMSIEYYTMDFIIKKRKFLKEKKRIILIKNKIKNIRKFIKQQKIKFKLKFIYYNTKYTEINNKTNELRSIYKKIKNKLNKVLYKRYKIIISTNSLAVVPIYKQIPVGNYILISKIKYSNLLERKNLIIDEQSGKILIDYDLAYKENKKMNKILFNKNFSFS
ncbi:hypothetical protein ONB78_00615 [Candidatus Karelsulcia muelleri]|uniref:hypothetical protein n=1 Tax=Candidatus Karelsulcia muelleri TaxID=336810 RepID=UPI0023634BCA|nr:hypothetical protein [Candidatus Karelsulcia muelleri]WDE42166.1 hypothetical protein ONB78_00615 [Candidatus Karelsulcia muelleri]WDR79155.1 hypothetical protein ONB77_00400 [Candidatus Karelsulcia muelleri]